MNSMQIPRFPVPVVLGPHWAQWLHNRVRAGFPSAAEDFGGERIDLSAILQSQDQATFCMRAEGDSMEAYGIFNDDILVISKAKRPRHGQIVVASVDGEFTVKKLYKKQGQTKLTAGNPAYPDITPQDGQVLEIWGVVTATVKQFQG